MDLLTLIDQYKELLDEKDRLKDESVENNKQIEAVRNQLTQVMIDEECPSVSRNGFKYTLQQKTKYNKRACDEDAFFGLLEDFGLGDIIKRTVNANTLSGAMQSVADENGGELPEEFSDFISVYEFYDVSKRKEANKTAAKAKSKED